jgi:hypothetical protein
LSIDDAGERGAVRAGAGLALVAVLAAGVAYWLWPRPLPVQTARVERGAVGSQADALRVPLDALVRRGGRWFAWEVDDGRANEIAVSVGERSAAYAEIVAGLAERDRVVVRPSPRIASGDRVQER